MNESQKRLVIESAIFLGGLPIVFLTAVFAVATVQLELRHPLQAVQALAIGGALTALAIVFSFRRSFERLERSRAVVLCLITLLFAGLSYSAAGKMYDVSYDGQTYHHEAISQLASGWNYFDPPSFPAPRGEMAYTAPFLTHYCKLPWLLSAVVYQATGNFEGAKCLQWILLWSVFWGGLGLLLSLDLSAAAALLFAALAALNPVSITQASTFYVDGLFASTTAFLLVISGLWVLERNTFTMLALGSAIVLGLQIKFTSTVTTGVFVFGLLLLLWHARDTSLIRPVAGLLLFSFVSCFVLGYQPFVTNWKTTGNVFYPVPTYSLAGETVESPAIQEIQLPENFRGEGRISKLARSLLSRSANPFGTGVSEWKRPFSASLEELRAFRSPDVRIGGFGPLFSGALLIAFASLAMLRAGLGKWPKHPMRGAFPVLVLPLWILFSALLNPECWWARYAPQLWLIPVVVCVQNRMVRGRQAFSDWLIAALLTVNTAGISVISLWSGYRRSSALKQELFLLHEEHRPFRVSFQRFRANERRLTERGIPFTEEPAPSCAEPRLLVESPTSVCPG